MRLHDDKFKRKQDSTPLYSDTEHTSFLQQYVIVQVCGCKTQREREREFEGSNYVITEHTRHYLTLNGCSPENMELLTCAMF